jgi:hypothetical protein
MASKSASFKNSRAGDLAQVLQCLSSKHAVLSLNPTNTKTKSKQTKNLNNIVYYCQALWLTPVIPAMQEKHCVHSLVPQNKFIHK